MNDWKTRYGSWAIVTGASSGLGREFALRFAQLELNLVLIARRTDMLEELSVECRSHKVDTLVVPMDLTEQNAIDNLMNQIGERDIGILVNNAGFGLAGRYTNLDRYQQVNMVQLNCAVPVELTHAVLPQMQRKDKGALITVSSLTGFLTNPYFSVYGATKAFDLLFAEALNCELNGTGIDSLILCPGLTRTDFLDKAQMKPRWLPVMTSETVVATAIKSLGHKLIVIPGVINRILAMVASIVPRCIVTPIAGAVLKHISEEDSTCR